MADNKKQTKAKKAAATPEEELSYFGIGICGAKKLVGRLTGNLPLLR